MFNSSTLCRQQELHHRSIAENTSLENVRKIALTAAHAWACQGVEATQREARGRPVLSKADAAIALEFQHETQAEHALPAMRAAC